MTTIHELRAWPNYFQPMWDGDKTFEIRYDDRGFQRGDQVLLREWDLKASCDCSNGKHGTTCARYTGRQIAAEIGYVMAFTPSRGNQRGFSGGGYVVFSICDPEMSETTTALVHEELVVGPPYLAPTPAVMGGQR